jgi:hypothetical protein
LISGSDDGVKLAIEVRSVAWPAVVGISVDVEVSLELETVSETVCEIVDSLDCVIEVVMNVNSLGSGVEVSGKVDILISLSSVDDNMSLNTSEVVVMTLIELVDGDVIE